MEWVVALIETCSLVHIARRKELPIQAVCPGVVRALDRAGKMAALLGTHLCSTMPADVEKCPCPRTTIPHDDQALVADPGEHIIAGLGDLVRSADADPLLIKNALCL